MTNEKSRDRKTETSILDESAKKRKDSVFVEEVAINESGRSLIISDQFSNENHSNSNNSLFGDSILKDINIKNFNSRLCKVKCASLVVRHQIISTIIFVPTFNETDVITDVGVLHVGINDKNSEVNKDLAADSIINTTKECIVFTIKSVYISSFTVNTRRNSTFISAVKKALKAKCLIHNFHFIDNSNIKKEHLWKHDLHLNLSSKDLEEKNFLRGIFLRNLKDHEIVT